MQARGKFIVFEGIDGSGKRTQVEALAQLLARRGAPFAQISFPNYHGFYGKLVAQFLNGEFGPLSAVDPHFSALLYAGDRLESKPAIESALAAGKILLADRYVASNLAHQGARMPDEKRGNFLAWLKQLEYDVHALPVEDLVVYLRVPVAEAHRLVGHKAARDYTKARRDLQESDTAHLEAASRIYGELARQPNWVTIDCYDATAGALRPAPAIHQEIADAVLSRLGISDAAAHQAKG
jgi:dTMP kinase